MPRPYGGFFIIFKLVGGKLAGNSRISGTGEVRTHCQSETERYTRKVSLSVNKMLHPKIKFIHKLNDICGVNFYVFQLFYRNPVKFQTEITPF